MKDDEDGVWRTICGRRVFIKDGWDLHEALRQSGKFEKLEEEKKKFDSLNRTAMNKINELTDILYNEEVTLEIQKFTDEEFDKIREANKDKVTNGGFVTIYKWLC